MSVLSPSCKHIYGHGKAQKNVMGRLQILFHFAKQRRIYSCTMHTRVDLHTKQPWLRDPHLQHLPRVFLRLSKHLPNFGDFTFLKKTKYFLSEFSTLFFAFLTKFFFSLSSVHQSDLLPCISWHKGPELKNLENIGTISHLSTSRKLTYSFTI